MWILPKTLTQSNGSLATAETISDLNECSQICASSLLVRSKSSPSKTFLRRWKQDSWRRLPYGRIAKPSLGNHSLIERTFSSRPILVNHSAQPASDKAPTTSGISGHTFTDGYYAPDLFSSSSKTSKDTYRWDSPQSSAIWKKEVTKRRGEYSARVKLARRTSGKEFSSWPTATMQDGKQGGITPFQAKGGNHTNLLHIAAIKEEQNWPTVCASEVRQGFQDRSRGMKGSQESLTTAVVKDAANWPTPNANEIQNPNKEYRSPCNAYRGDKKVQPMLCDAVHHYGQAAPASSSSLGSRQELWPTARSLDGQINESLESWTARRDRKQTEGINLHRPLPIAVMQEQFPTPRTCDWKSSPNADSNIKRMEVGQATLAEFVHAKHKKGDLWSTPRTGATESSRPNNKGGIPLADQAKRSWATPKANEIPTGKNAQGGLSLTSQNSNGKLNPRWVETLMGLPIGWTMPSCTSPQTIEPTSCDSSAMESCLPPQSEPLELSLAS
jgi:hypothetical protein